LFKVEGREDDWNNWKSTINDKINNTVDMIVFILPGGKKMASSIMK
jgi:hypothetical protein